MIKFEPILSGNILIMVLGVLALISVFQVFYYLFKKVERRYLKVFLFLLFSSLLSLFILNPTWEKELPGSSALLIPESENKAHFSDFSKELEVDKVIKAGERAEGFRQLYIFGENYKKEELLSLPLVDMEWIPSSDKSFVVLDLGWEGILKYGQEQKITGILNSEKSQKLQLRFVNEVWAEQTLEDGEQSFELVFSALILGKNEMDLYLDESKIGTVRYFVMGPEQMSFELKVGFPNPETRFFADYLRKRGELVSLRTQVAQSSSIVAGEELADRSVLVIDPSQLKSVDVNKLGSDYQAVLLTNVNNPELDISELNRKFGTSFTINRISEKSVEKENGTSAQAFDFVTKFNQDTLKNSATAFEMKGDHTIAVSLMEDSFSLLLSGDSIGYAKVWEPVFEKLSMGNKNSFQLSSPVFRNLKSNISFLGASDSPNNLQNEQLSFTWKKDALIGDMYFSRFIPLESGWIYFSDSLSIYVEDEESFKAVKGRKILIEFLKERRDYGFGSERITSKSNIPAWLWFVLILISASLLWVEPRYRS
ncbi:hypothetical protein A33Q_0823 [Indibacter alkaliphilus LW1]|uniref:Uncharacterized protein n=1 Tax=Indibacter alkaliphilus (strain CCUG 57479 / KCTC 22604 / LW1) TaxID=1189612 RepID=S2DPL7_INDAL|nr:hypothetical protein [Indibacter alkaliphilus]EOZ99115.1 hypothetical protein A33Q_0823 [Indibacter alkaliphilus LW1]